MARQSNQQQFEKVATFSDSLGAVHHIAFARSLAHGLRLACVGSDCTVRVYNAPDLADLKHWNLVFKYRLPLFDDPSKLNAATNRRRGVRDFQGDFAVDWCTTSFIVVSPSSTSSNSIQTQLEQFVVSAMNRAFIFRRSAVVDAPGFGINSDSKTNQTYDDIRQDSNNESDNSSSEIMDDQDNEEDENSNGEESTYYTLKEELTGHGDTIHDISWSNGSSIPQSALPPNVISSECDEHIATACKDGVVRIFTLRRRIEEPISKLNYDVILSDQFDDHHSEVWKVSWNVSGTMLSSSGDDGRVRLWKQAYNGEFQCMGVISAEKSTYVCTFFKPTSFIILLIT